MLRPSGKGSPVFKSLQLIGCGNPRQRFGQQTMDHLLGFRFDMSVRVALLATYLRTIILVLEFRNRGRLQIRTSELFADRARRTTS